MLTPLFWYESSRNLKKLLKDIFNNVLQILIYSVLENFHGGGLWDASSRNIQTDTIDLVTVYLLELVAQPRSVSPAEAQPSSAK